MILGFGFGDPIQSIVMLLLTSLISYAVFRSIRTIGHGKQDPLIEREKRRQFYYEQRERAREYAREFNLTDEEIEKRLDEEFR